MFNETYLPCNLSLDVFLSVKINTRASDFIFNQQFKVVQITKYITIQ